MKFVTVEYRELRTFGGYQNKTVGGTVLVGEDDSAEATLEDLKTWVQEQLGDEQERANLNSAVHELRWRKDELERQITRANEKWEAIVAFMGKLGIDWPADIPDTLESLPF